MFEEGLRGLGGGGALVDDAGVEKSPVALRSAIGFLGGAGTDFVLATDDTDVRCPGPTACVSVLTRRREVCRLGSSTGEERSMRSPMGGGRDAGSDRRGGSCGLDSG